MSINDENYEKIQDKIRNLLEKTVENGCSEHEAEQAILKAQELMLKYSIELESIQDAGSQKRKVITRCKEFKDRKLQNFHLILLQLITSNFRTKCFYNRTRVYIMGFEEDVAASGTLFSFIIDYIEYAFKEFLKKSKQENPDAFVNAGASYSKYLKRQYINGFIMGLEYSFLQRLKEDNRYALMVTTPQEVEEEFSNLDIGSKRVETKHEKTDVGAFASGVIGGLSCLSKHELEGHSDEAEEK